MISDAVCTVAPLALLAKESCLLSSLLCVLVPVQEGFCGYANLFPFALFYFHSIRLYLSVTLE